MNMPLPMNLAMNLDIRPVVLTPEVLVGRIYMNALRGADDLSADLLADQIADQFRQNMAQLRVQCLSLGTPAFQPFMNLIDQCEQYVLWHIEEGGEFDR